MKSQRYKLALVILMSLIVSACTTKDPIQLVREGTSPYNSGITIGQAFDTWTGCDENTKTWETHETGRGEVIVFFKCEKKLFPDIAATADAFRKQNEKPIFAVSSAMLKAEEELRKKDVTERAKESTFKRILYTQSFQINAEKTDFKTGPGYFRFEFNNEAQSDLLNIGDKGLNIVYSNEVLMSDNWAEHMILSTQLPAKSR